MSIWAVVPAAGVGRRMGSEIPKQYLPLGDSCVLQQTLQRLAAIPFIDGVVVALGVADDRWPELRLNLPLPLVTVSGGAERVHSVANAVDWLMQNRLQSEDWVLVHDAARPCLRAADVALLWQRVAGHDCGGILATPVRDTMKRSHVDKSIAATVERSDLWHALTPQLFRAGLLQEALQAGLKNPAQITDEASALEAIGYAPLLVEGHADNLKITRPEDLALAEFYLQLEARVI